MPLVSNKKFKGLIRLSYTWSNLMKKYRINIYHRLESNFSLMKRHITAYYGLTKYKDLKHHTCSPSLLANLETSADIILFSLHWVQSIFEASDFIRKGFLWMGPKSVLNPNQHLIPNQIFSLMYCRINPIMRHLNEITSQNLKKNWSVKMENPSSKFYALTQLDPFMTQRETSKYWEYWILYPSHLLVDEGMMMGSVINWPKYPYPQIPFLNLEGFGQYMKSW